MNTEMQPVYPVRRPAPAAPTSQDDLADSDNEGASVPPSPPSPPRRTFQEFARANWIPLAIGLVILMFVSAFFYARSLAQQETAAVSPVAAASHNLEPTITAPAPAAAPEPTDVLEQKQAADQRQKMGAPAAPVTADQLAAGMAVDTFGRAAARQARQQQVQQQAAAAARRASLPPPDSIEVTTRDGQTGAYRPQRVAVSRRSSGGSGSGSNSSSSDVRRRLRPAARPRMAPDGVVYEQNDDVLDMLDSSPPAARASYEQMTGRRYFDRRAAARAGGSQALVNPNGAVVAVDPFGTVKAGSYRYNADNSQAANNQPLLPDIFYKCVVNGEQRVRTGSVVMLRLMEDAIISGQTFPKNLVFAGIANVETNRVTIAINRLGPTRVAADIYDYNYLAGVMIDPQKKQPVDPSNNPLNDARMMGSQEIGTAIDRSASAANSVVGVAGRIGTSMVSRLGSSHHRKLRDVLLPDGYPTLITTGATDAAVSANQ